MSEPIFSSQKALDEKSSFRTAESCWNLKFTSSFRKDSAA